MKNHFNFTDAEFETRFETGTLDPGYFTHEGHLRMAWIFIMKYGATEGSARMAKTLFKFVCAAGAPARYNHTVTIAAMKMVHHFMRRTPADDFPGFIEKNPRLVSRFRELLSCHYSVDVFTNPSARELFLEPDLLPFD